MEVTYIDHMGSDARVVDAARVSFSKESANYTPEQNEKLIKFLAKHNHWSPAAHPQITLRCSAPVPIQTQCFKHKQGLVENGESRRYVDYEPVVYFPDVWRRKSEHKKQGSSDEEVKTLWFHNNVEGWECSVGEAYANAVECCLQTYDAMIKAGVAPEQARFVLPQGTELMWIWTGSLYAFTRVYHLRSAPDSQKEIRDMADMIDKIIRPLFPITWGAYVDGK